MSPRPTEPTRSSPGAAARADQPVKPQNSIARKNSGKVATLRRSTLRRSAQPNASAAGAARRGRQPRWKGRSWRGRSWRRAGPARRSALGVLAGLVVLAALVWLVAVSGVLAVRAITVFGAERQDPSAVRTGLVTEIGRPLARVDTDRAAQRVETLPAVKSADVVRAWPNTLEVRVVERVPLAWVRRGPDYALMDRDGVRVATVAAEPAELAELDPATLAAGGRAVAAAMTALHTMPTDVRDQIATAQADTQDSVTFTLRSGAKVVWGSSEDSARKAEVLSALVNREAAVYDVSAPRTPVTR